MHTHPGVLRVWRRWSPGRLLARAISPKLTHGALQEQAVQSERSVGWNIHTVRQESQVPDGEGACSATQHYIAAELHRRVPSSPGARVDHVHVCGNLDDRGLLVAEGRVQLRRRAHHDCVHAVCSSSELKTRQPGPRQHSPEDGLHGTTRATTHSTWVTSTHAAAVHAVFFQTRTPPTGKAASSRELPSRHVLKGNDPRERPVAPETARLAYAVPACNQSVDNLLGPVSGSACATAQPSNAVGGCMCTTKAVCRCPDILPLIGSIYSCYLLVILTKKMHPMMWSARGRARGRGTLWPGDMQHALG